MKKNDELKIYWDVFVLFDNIYRNFLQSIEIKLRDSVKCEINPNQFVILYNMWRSNPNNREFTVGDIKESYYLGSNSTYNINNMIKKGYLVKKQNLSDKRSKYIQITPKGISLCEKFKEYFDDQFLYKCGVKDNWMPSLKKIVKHLNLLMR